MMGKVSQEVRERYNNKTYDKITFRTRKDDLPASEIHEAAKQEKKSLNAFIVDAIKEHLGKPIDQE